MDFRNLEVLNVFGANVEVPKVLRVDCPSHTFESFKESIPVISKSRFRQTFSFMVYVYGSMNRSTTEGRYVHKMWQ